MYDSTQLITAPEVEPITLAEAKAHLGVTVDDDDALITALIRAARRAAEKYTRRAFITQEWDVRYECFERRIDLPLAPLQSVVSVKYVDPDNATQTADTSLYEVDTAHEPGRIFQALNQQWPSTRRMENSVIINLIAGYGDAGDDVPDDIKAAIYLLVGQLYENRESIVVGTINSEVTGPGAYYALLAPYVVYS